MSTQHRTEVFAVALPLARVWDVMADTQHLNQLFFGLEAATMVSRDGDKARLRGTFGILAPEYDEYPWIFEVPNRYANERIFTRGLLRRLASRCELKAIDDANTEVTYAVDVDGVGPLGGIAARYVVYRTVQGLKQARGMLTSMATSTQVATALQWPPANPYREATLAKARPLADEVRRQLPSMPGPSVLELLLLHVADGTDADVARMRPYELADAWSTPRAETLGVFLRSARGGLLRLSWDLLCPSCEAPTTVSSLKDLPDAGHCPACDIDFTTSFDENVEATFSPEPTVRAAERLVFCHGSPSSTKSWLAQFLVDAGQASSLRLRLGAGRYRLQSAGLAAPAHFDIVEGSGVVEADVAITTTDGVDGLSPVPTLRAGEIALHITNTTAERHRVQLAHRAFASKAATAADVTSLGLFRELFGNEVLSPDQHVVVGRTTILFTDLVGSTAMYERLGDAAAYGLVRRHFGLLTAAISAANGRIVKTVGDAVMAAFDIPADAVAAGLGCITALRTLEGPGRGPSGLRLKVGVHTGACLAIEANGATDYFGRTVNIAARVESLASPDELVLSWTMLEDADVAAAVTAAASTGAVVSTDRRKVKGIDDEVEVTRIALPGNP